VKKRGWIILGLLVLFGTYAFVVGYEFLEKENALRQKKVKAAKEEQRRCQARLSKYRNFDQFRTSIRLPYASDLSLERWQQQYNTLRAGMSESEVEIIMGAPDYASCDLTKEGDKFAGSSWRYVVAVPQDAANDSQNSAIHLIFGPDAKLKDKSVANMQPKPSSASTASPSPSPTSTPSPSETTTPAASPSATPGASASPTAVPIASPTATPTTSPQ
jgi:outer membrane protein assembly factor BamE (lipoprotein component of BamABCDE complex)